MYSRATFSFLRNVFSLFNQPRKFWQRAMPHWFPLPCQPSRSQIVAREVVFVHSFRNPPLSLQSEAWNESSSWEVEDNKSSLKITNVGQHNHTFSENAMKSDDKGNTELILMRSSLFWVIKLICPRSLSWRQRHSVITRNKVQIYVSRCMPSWESSRKCPRLRPTSTWPREPGPRSTVLRWWQILNSHNLNGYLTICRTLPGKTAGCHHIREKSSPFPGRILRKRSIWQWKLRSRTNSRHQSCVSKPLAAGASSCNLGLILRKYHILIHFQGKRHRPCHQHGNGAPSAGLRAWRQACQVRSERYARTESETVFSGELKKFQNLGHTGYTVHNQVASISYPKETTKLIHEAHENKVKCLVHCIAGVSRSASVCVAYLMKYRSVLGELWNCAGNVYLCL